MIRKNDNKTIAKIDTKHKDILRGKLKVNHCTVQIILVYMATNDSKRNKTIEKKTYYCSLTLFCYTEKGG